MYCIERSLLLCLRSFGRSIRKDNSTGGVGFKIPSLYDINMFDTVCFLCRLSMAEEKLT